MLELAAPAGSENRAERRRALGRLSQQLEHFADGVAALARLDANPRPLSRQRAKAEDDERLRAAHPLAVSEYVGKFDLELVTGVQAGADR